MIATFGPAAAPTSREKGFTLTEIAIVLGIMGLILGAIWTAASSVYQNQRVAHAQTAVLQMAQAVRTLYSSQSSTGLAAATDITPVLINAGATPTDLGTGDPMSGPFPNGQTAIIGTSDGNGFVIAMSNLSGPNCVALLTGVAGNTRDAGLYNADALAAAAPAASDATTTGTPIAAITPTIASAAAAGAAPSKSGGCTGSSNYKVRFGFTLK